MFEFVTKQPSRIESLERLSHTLESASVGVWQLDIVNKICYWNSITAELMGYEPTKITANREDFFSRVYPDDRLGLQYIFDRSRTERSRFVHEFRVRYPNGEIHWVSVNCGFTYTSSGLAIAAGGIIVNIDKKKEEEFVLRFREQGFLRLYESNLIGISFGELGGPVLEANDAYLKLVGWTRERLQKEGTIDWRKITPPEYDVVDEHAILLADRNGVSDVYEKEYILEDGSRKAILIGIAKMNKTHAISFLLDTTKQKTAENLLRESHERYANFISQSTEGIWRFELDQPLPISLPVNEQIEFIYKHSYLAECNDAFAKMYGFRWADEANGKRLGDIMPLKHVYHFLRNFIESGYKVVDFEAKQLANNGRVLFSATSLTGFCGDGFLKRGWGVQRDITSQKLSEIELIRAREQAEAANNAKTAFLANVSHEIRTPLGAILGFTEFLQDSATTTSEADRKKFREIIERNGQELTRLIDDLLDLSKAEAGHLEIVREYFDVGEVIEDVVGIMKSKAQAKNISLVHKINHDKRPICSDKTRIRQILLNLVANAIKFTQEGQVVVSTRYIEGRPNILEFTITDTGIGISVQQMDRLFKPFSQADDSFTRRFGGTGLGLALSKRLAKIVGGDVCLAESVVGKGSVFKFTIEDYQVCQRSDKPSVSKVAPTHLKGLKVLVVDDSPDNRMLLDRLLKKHEIEVDLAADGKKGVEMALTQPYDLILMDLQMPVMDGYTATKLLRQNGYQKAIIAFTAHAMNDDREKCLQIGCTDHVAKPVSAEELVRKIAEHVHVKDRQTKLESF